MSTPACAGLRYGLPVPLSTPPLRFSTAANSDSWEGDERDGRCRMRRPLSALVIAATVLTACGTVRDSRLNPFNWFGGSREVAVEADAGPRNPLMPSRNRLLAREDEVYAGVPIDTVTGLEIERTLSGAILRATGVARQQGPYDVRLTPQQPDGVPVEGVLSYSFDVVYPRTPRPVGTERSRRVVAAVSLTHDELEGVRVIRVLGARNARESRRR